MRTKLGLLIVAAAMVALLVGSTGLVRADLLTNGDFQSWTGTPEYPLGWTVAADELATRHRGLTATGLDNELANYGASLHRFTDIAEATLSQAVATGPQWELDFLWCGERPSTPRRALHFYTTTASSELLWNINMRANTDGLLQVYSGSDWVTLNGDAGDPLFSWSVDGNGDGDFEDVEDTVNVHSLRIIGDYSRATPSYDVYMSAANSATLVEVADNISVFHGAAAVGEGLTAISFRTTNSTYVDLPDRGIVQVVDQVSLTSPGTPGDFDFDGDVDGADFVAWQTHFPTASGATLADGDADGDGDVDGADFVVWQTHFPYTPGPGASAVPEPQAWMLFGLALTGFFSLGDIPGFGGHTRGRAGTWL